MVARPAEPADGANTAPINGSRSTRLKYSAATSRLRPHLLSAIRRGCWGPTALFRLNPGRHNLSTELRTTGLRFSSPDADLLGQPNSTNRKEIHMSRTTYSHKDRAWRAARKSHRPRHCRRNAFNPAWPSPSPMDGR